MKGNIESQLDENGEVIVYDKRSAGLLSVFFMTLAIQFAGSVGGWNNGSEYGLIQLLFANLIVGLLYVLLSVCLGELTSIVAFPGGSFGYCRCAFGPFFGYLVGTL